jgi:acyl-CoA synthetase (AMP-forming)/AMP-acid ligase II
MPITDRLTTTLGLVTTMVRAGALGVDDEQYGQRLAAFVVASPGAAASPEALKAYVRENLANYKVPRSVTVLEGLPRGSTGKILRSDLQELVREQGGGSVDAATS